MRVPAAVGDAPRPTPPPAAPKRACSTCQAGHGDLNAAAHCAAAHAARSVAYAWVDAQPDPIEVVISLGWRPVDLDDDEGSE